MWVLIIEIYSLMNTKTVFYHSKNLRENIITRLFNTEDYMLRENVRVGYMR